MEWRQFWNRMMGVRPEEGEAVHLPPVDRKNLIRRRIYFSGEVQGVGFRFRCMNHAKDLGVTGFAQNLLDGRVRAEFQSDAAHIDELIRRLEREPWIRIDDMQVTDRPLEPKEKGFIVDYF